MSVFDLFSKRQARSQGVTPPLQMDALPEKFLRQVVTIFRHTIGQCSYINPYSDRLTPGHPPNEVWVGIHDAISREHGLFSLGQAGDPPDVQCMTYLMTAKTADALDVMEFTLAFIDGNLRRDDLDLYAHLAGVRPDPDAAIAEFNTRCRENGVGYAFENSRIIPVASTYAHTEVVEPALALLHEEGFRGAQDEFMRAHLHLRRGDTKNAIVEAGKAFESAMKTVCARRGWDHDPGATAKPLVATLLKNGFFPPYLESQLTHLRCLLETGAPVVRNREGAHGQGAELVEVPRELAEYAIHLTAANIVLIAKLFGR